MEAALKFLESEGYSKPRPVRPDNKVKCPNCGSMLKRAGLKAHRNTKKCINHS